MFCTNHREATATGNCAGCAEPFCGNCLIGIGGKSFCGQCKTMAVAAGSGPAGVCHDAGEALKYAIIGIFCFGIILEPIAIFKAFSARKQIAANPRLEGAGKALAALIIGFVGLLLWILGVIARVAEMKGA